MIANFLFGYYEQDGIHSPVTGGTGTEKLNDYASIIVVNVPVDTTVGMSFMAGFNQYTSASTDRINNVTSASRTDGRFQANLGYSVKNKQKKLTRGFNAGGSIESDYISSSLGANLSKESSDGNRGFSLAFQAFFDTWLLIFPDELRSTAPLSVETDKRTSLNLQFNLSSVVNKKTNAAVSFDLNHQYGLLSTPFHRVYFSDKSMPAIEKLPDTRLKIPVSVRFNYFAFDKVIFRFFYRFYYDSWKINAHTINLEVPCKLTGSLTIYPFMRFHHQNGTPYFRPFREHLSTSNYYTSDFDLSTINTLKKGVGIRFAPLYGICRFNKVENIRESQLKAIDLRYSMTNRSDGLSSFLLSLGLEFKFH